MLSFSVAQLQPVYQHQRVVAAVLSQSLAYQVLLQHTPHRWHLHWHSAAIPLQVQHSPTTVISIVSPSCKYLSKTHRGANHHQQDSAERSAKQKPPKKREAFAQQKFFSEITATKTQDHRPEYYSYIKISKQQNRVIRPLTTRR